MYRYLVIINSICFILMGYDKYQAIHKKDRIPEIILITLALIGGSLGAILGMYTFHHKTKKIKFHILFTIFLIIHMILLLK